MNSRTSLARLCGACAMALGLATTAHASQAFRFSFTDLDGYSNGSGSVLGIVALDGNGDGSFAATSVELTDLPAISASDLVGADRFFDTFGGSNTFVVSGGNIVSASMVAFNALAVLTLYYNAGPNTGETGFLDTPNVTAMDMHGGLETLSFTPIASPSAVPEPAPWVLFAAGAGLLGARARRRAAAQAT